VFAFQKYLGGNIKMGKEELIKTIQRILATDVDLDFLLQLEENDLEILVACIREGIDNNE
jgi:hypothetical protein